MGNCAAAGSAATGRRIPSTGWISRRGSRCPDAPRHVTNQADGRDERQGRGSTVRDQRNTTRRVRRSGGPGDARCITRLSTVNQRPGIPFRAAPTSIYDEDSRPHPCLLQRIFQVAAPMSRGTTNSPDTAAACQVTIARTFGAQSDHGESPSIREGNRRPSHRVGAPQLPANPCAGLPTPGPATLDFRRFHGTAIDRGIRRRRPRRASRGWGRGSGPPGPQRAPGVDREPLHECSLQTSPPACLATGPRSFRMTIVDQLLWRTLDDRN